MGGSWWAPPRGSQFWGCLQTVLRGMVRLGGDAEAAADEAAPAALRAAPRPTAKQGYSFGAIGLVALFAVGAAVVGAIRARARSGPQYVRQTNPDELV